MTSSGVHPLTQLCVHSSNIIIGVYVVIFGLGELHHVVQSPSTTSCARRYFLKLLYANAALYQQLLLLSSSRSPLRCPVTPLFLFSFLGRGICRLSPWR